MICVSARSILVTFVLFSGVCLAGELHAAPIVKETSREISQKSVSMQDAKREGNIRDTSPYLIGPQNLIQIKIFGEAAVGQIYRVEDDGYVKHALLGRIQVAGMTVPELEKTIEAQLDGDYIINPQVTVFVLEYSHFSIMGEIRKPGNYELTGRVTIIRALSMAGGFTPVANQKGVQIIRKNIDGTETKIAVDTTRITQGGDLSGEIDVEPDDIIVVPKSFF